MNIYIQGMGCVSPQQTAGEGPFLAPVREYEGNRLKVVDPDYKQWIADANMMRRMGRVVKMGIAAARLSMQQAGIAMPDAIITGTAYGCLADTGVFLTRMIQGEEKSLSPTPFIQSTHNTVSGQIALLLGCHAYNSTFVHKGFSFESALLDSIMILRENAARQVLTGGVDEITDHSHAILSRFGLYKQEAVRNTTLLQSSTHGTIAGEGAAFFVLGAEKGAHTVARLTGLATVYKPASEQEVSGAIQDFLATHGLGAADIDLLVAGRNGNVREDAGYTRLAATLFPQTPVAAFKHLCGEYPTATAFATWLGAAMLQQQQVPAGVLYNGAAPQQLNRILIYNRYQGTHHALVLLEKA
jgi:3-oxoacyl-(acyl-carrier-protein) synthase